MSAKHARKVATISEAVLNQFRSYSWPATFASCATLWSAP